MAKVLVIAPHTDDEVLGVGGTMRKHVEQGDEVHICIAADHATDHVYDPAVIEQLRACAVGAANVLGCKEVHFCGLKDEQLGASLIDLIMAVERVIDLVRPEVVYVPNRSDNNQDHQDLFRAAAVALRPLAPWKVQTVLMYEVLSSTDQMVPLLERAFVPNYFVDISAQLEAKLAAMCEYESELRPEPHPRSLEGIRINARYWGMRYGRHAAEAFMLLRHWA